MGVKFYTAAQNVDSLVTNVTENSVGNQMLRTGWFPFGDAPFLLFRLQRKRFRITGFSVCFAHLKNAMTPKLSKRGMGEGKEANACRETRQF